MVVYINSERKMSYFMHFPLTDDQNRSTFTPANRPTYVLESRISKTLH